MEEVLKGQRDACSCRDTLAKIQEWRGKEEMLWWQRARSDYLKFGDFNTRWFHSIANMRKAMNFIQGLEDVDGVIQPEQEAMEQIAADYFTNLFSSSDVLSCIEPWVSETMNDVLCAPYTRLEVDEALKQMHPHKAPSFDGLSSFFFQRFCEIVGDDVSSAVLEILHGHAIRPRPNHAFVVLLPKKLKPSKMSEFRLISLCNVIYKPVTKVINNQLKHILHNIMSDSQSGFTPGRLITDNILVACELFHVMNINTCVMGSMAIKLDMAKAYDRVEWPFLARVMGKLGFRPHWIELVMKCVKFASFSFLVNGVPVGHVVPSWGLRQGDPISPCSFIFVSEGLSRLLKCAVERGSLYGVRLCPAAPVISHLLFVDDTVIFCPTAESQALTVKEVLHKYKRASGQKVNFNKTNVLFSRGI